LVDVVRPDPDEVPDNKSLDGEQAEGQATDELLDKHDRLRGAEADPTPAAAVQSPSEVVATGQDDGVVRHERSPLATSRMVSASANDHDSPRRLSLNPSALLSVAGLLGLLAYGVAYQTARGFYGFFQLTPHEVGYAQQDAAADAVLVAIRYGAVLFILAPLIALSVWLGRQLGRATQGRIRMPPSLIFMLKYLALSVLVVALGYSLFWGPILVAERGQQLALQFQTGQLSGGERSISGRPTEDPAVFEVSPTWFEPVIPGGSLSKGQARWVTARADGRLTVHRSEVLTLGAREGATYLWDLCALTSRRIPTGSLIVDIPMSGSEGEAGAVERGLEEVVDYCS